MPVSPSFCSESWLTLPSFSTVPSLLNLQCYEMCNAGAVIHSHGMETAMITMVKPGAKEFRVSGSEPFSLSQHQLQ